MKLYLSADIEGVCGIAHWDETDKASKDHEEFRKQMTREVSAACEGAASSGALDILVKDAHWTGRNIVAEDLPQNVRIVRGWSGDPLKMVQGLDRSFQAIGFIGYHSRAGSGGNPMAHTMSGSRVAEICFNDQPVSEFLMHSYAAAYFGVPPIFLAGDAQLCEEVKKLNENIITVPVVEGVGDSTVSIHPQLARERIREGMREALRRDISRCNLTLPPKFQVSLRHKIHTHSYKAGYYPGARRRDDHTITFESSDYYEVMRMLSFTI